MALIESNTFENGTQAPEFKLLNTVDNKFYSLPELKGDKGTAVFFICNHCPYVIHINEQLVQVANDYLSRGIAFIAISSNDVESYPQDAPEKMTEVAQSLKYPFPYLYDETQEVAKAYKAACTPDLYLFDGDLKSIFHGQLDSSRPGNGLEVTGEDFRGAMDALLENREIPEARPSIGCSIKWRNL